MTSPVLTSRRQGGMMIRNIVPQLPERGKIKIGGVGPERRSKDGTKTWRVPEKYDFFRVTTLDRGDDGNFVRDDEIHSLPGIGEKPRMLPIRLLFDDPHRNLSSSYACRKGKRVWCRGDGQTAEREQNGASGGKVTVECPCPRIQVDYEGSDPCKFNGILSCIIEGAPCVGGVWKFRTTSYNSVVSLMSSMGMIQQLSGGCLAGIPLQLVMHAKLTEDPSGKPQTIQFVSLEFRGDPDELREIGLRRRREELDYQLNVREIEEKIARVTALPPPAAKGVFEGDDGESDDEFNPPNIDPETGEILEDQDHTPQQLGADPLLSGGAQPSTTPSLEHPAGQSGTSARRPETAGGATRESATPGGMAAPQKITPQPQKRGAAEKGLAPASAPHGPGSPSETTDSAAPPLGGGSNADLLDIPAWMDKRNSGAASSPQNAPDQPEGGVSSPPSSGDQSSVSLADHELGVLEGAEIAAEGGIESLTRYCEGKNDAEKDLLRAHWSALSQKAMRHNTKEDSA